jgi:uncharacterized protein YqeY
MNIEQQLREDMKTAMRGGEKLRLLVIRGALAALKSAQMAQVEAAYDQALAAAPKQVGPDGQVIPPEITIDRNLPLSETAMQETLAKELKRRRDAIELYQKGGRLDLADQEQAEAAILEAYLPRQLTADELRPQMEAAISALGASSMADMGKIMPTLVQQFKGSADGRLISQLAREILGRGK